MSELWQESLRQAFKNTDELSTFLDTPISNVTYPLFIPQELARKIKTQGKDGPLWKQFIPTKHEESNQEGLLDPIGDHTYAKASQLIHRYENKALFLPTTFCPVQCRYCFRKNELHEPDELFVSKMESTIQYLEKNSQIEEIIFSGGDPLILSDSKLDSLVTEISKISHIKYLRFHSRVPVSLAERITPTLLSLLEKWADSFDALTLVIHTNHFSEIEAKEKEVLGLLRRLPLHLLSQSVLLKGVNDNLSELSNLFKGLSSLGVKPYYLHHPDRAKGTEHFWLSLEEGRKIYHKLKTQLPGWMIPHYILDLPNGEGKTLAFNPQAWESDQTFINKSGGFSSYFER